MVTIRERDDDGNIVKPTNAEERRDLWNQCMREVKGTLVQEEFNRITGEVYDCTFTSLSDSDFDSSSLGSLEVLMETLAPSDLEVMGYKNNSMDDEETTKL